MARYNPFAEHAGMKKICESKPDKSILDAVAELEKLGFTSYLLAVPEYNKRMLKGRVSQVKKSLVASVILTTEESQVRMETSP